MSLIYAQRPMEYLDRGLVALETNTGVFLSWRMLGTDDASIGFNIYKNNIKLNSNPITTSTNYEDPAGTSSDLYKVESIFSSGNELSSEVSVWPYAAAYQSGKPNLARLEIPIPTAPASGLTPGDMSVGDLDGDGDYEFIFQWEGAREDVPYLDAIDLEGNHLWRINLGPNVIYNGISILVYDFDGDGRAEVTCQTAAGAIDGLGNHLSKGPAATDDNTKIYQRIAGRIVEDPAYFTVFDGLTGAELDTKEWPVPIGPLEDMEDTWGDNYGHRANSTKGAILHDAVKGPMMVFTRGIYTKIGMGAYTWDGNNIQQEWVFDSDNYTGGQYRGEGNHALAVADVDGDGSDELIYGACAIDNDGVGLYTTGRGHGDAHALGDLDPDRPGLEFFQPHENGTYGFSFRDAATGQVLWEVLSPADVGRAWAADITENNRGFEMSVIGDYIDNGVSDHSSVFDVDGNPLTYGYNAYYQPVYFDGDLERELRKDTGVDDVNHGGRIFTGWYYGASSIHSSKQDANLVADILGDWREEIVFKKADNSAFVIFSTWIPTTHKVYTLMHNPAYRMQVATQNVGYNQPANLSYYLADGSVQANINTTKSNLTWLGITSNNFAIASNFNHGVLPTGSDELKIPNMVNDPQITTNHPGKYVNNITLESEANLTVSAQLWTYNRSYFSGTVTVNTGADFNLRNRVDFGVKANSVLNVNGGTINSRSYMSLGFGYDVEANINGGLLSSESDMFLGKYGGDATVNINSGNVTVRSISIYDGSEINIDTGVLTLTGGNYTSNITAYVNDAKIIPASGKEIISSFDSNTGRTTVTAVNSNSSKLSIDVIAVGTKAYVSNVDRKADISVYSFTGVLVKKLTINKNDDFDLEPGIWIVTIKTSEATKSIKLLCK
ncbi:rhamnogalacturonan lyase family protein [Wenyingzhuangia sp. IMCC45467]